jgi:hypothetical protein
MYRKKKKNILIERKCYNLEIAELPLAPVI